MFRLLDLPSELRSLIIEYALLVPQTPPQGPWNGRKDRISPEDVQYKSWSIGPKNVFYKSDESSNLPVCRLLLLNHQIHDETISIVRRMTRVSYHVDVMAIHEFELWPTWLSVPAIRTHVDEVRMDLRIFGHCLDRMASLRYRCDSGPYIFEWCFYAMLERFLIYGPLNRGKAKADEKSRTVFIKTLVIDFTAHPDETYRLASPDLGAQDHWRWICANVMRRPHQLGYDFADMMPRPEWVASHLSGSISSLLRMGYHELYYGGVLYEHIGTIRILVEGTLYETFDLAKKLASLRFDCDQSVFTRKDREIYFWKWKKTALKKRLDAGLPVVWPDDPELEDTLA